MKICKFDLKKKELKSKKRRQNDENLTNKNRKKNKKLKSKKRRQNDENLK